MKEILVRIGNLNTKIDTDIDDYFSYFKYFLQNEFFQLQRDVELIIEIKSSLNFAKKDSIIMQQYKNSHIALAKKISLESSDYLYLEDENKYFINGDGFIGMIDISQCQVFWEINSVIDPRSAFHLLVLDPISLIAPKFSTMIYHGALINQNSKSSIAFLGMSGVGKSTVSRLVSEKYGKAKVSDDTFAIFVKEDKVFVQPFFTGEGYLKGLKNFKSHDYDFILENEKKIYQFRIPNVNLDTTLDSILVLEKMDKDSSSTNLSLLTSTQLLMQLLKHQASISNPFVLKRLNMNKEISSLCNGYLVTYKEICDIECFVNIMIHFDE